MTIQVYPSFGSEILSPTPFSIHFIPSSSPPNHPSKAFISSMAFLTLSKVSNFLAQLSVGTPNSMNSYEFHFQIPMTSCKAWITPLLPLLPISFCSTLHDFWFLQLQVPKKNGIRSSTALPSGIPSGIPHTLIANVVKRASCCFKKLFEGWDERRHINLYPSVQMLTLILVIFKPGMDSYGFHWTRGLRSNPHWTRKYWQNLKLNSWIPWQP